MISFQLLSQLSSPQGTLVLMHTHNLQQSFIQNCPCFNPPPPSIFPPPLSGHTSLPACLDFNLISPSPLHLSLYLSQGYCCCISSLIFPLIFPFCSLPLISLSPFNLHSLLSAFITPFIFVLLQTQVFVHRHTCAQSRTHKHTGAHLFGHAGIHRSKCR